MCCTQHYLDKAFLFYFTYYFLSWQHFGFQVLINLFILKGKRKFVICTHIYLALAI